MRDFASPRAPRYDARVSTVNALAREISAKIVYYGPGLSGKTTSLQRVYDFVRPESRGQLISLNTEGDRTLFFDFLPLQIQQVRGLSIRLQLYTVPGQVFYDATRKLVLNGADGVVFVADSQPAAHDRNLESMDNLRENLGELGIDLDAFPLVIEYNKRDLPSALPVANRRASDQCQSRTRIDSPIPINRIYRRRNSKRQRNKFCQSGRANPGDS